MPQPPVLDEQLEDTIRSLQQRDMWSREFSLRAESANADERSFEAVVASETRAAIYDYREYEVIDEVLVARGGEFPDQVPLLNNHMRSNIESQMGSARNFRMDGDKWLGRGYIGRAVAGNPQREQVWQDIADGHMRAVSIGYQVMDYVDIPTGGSRTVNGRRYEAGGRRLRISTQWRVHELSLTPIGADSLALIRSALGQSARPTQRRSYFAR